MLDATQLKGWGGVGHVNVPCRERRKELADSSFDMLSLSRIEITILSVRCTSIHMCVFFLDFRFSPFSMLFAAFWSWKLPFPRYVQRF